MKKDRAIQHKKVPHTPHDSQSDEAIIELIMRISWDIINCYRMPFLKNEHM